MAHLGDVADLIGGGTPSKSVSDYWSGDIPWASVRDLKARWLTSTEFKISQNAVEESSTHVIPSGQVVIATRVGLGKVVQLGQPTAINQDLRAIIPKNPQTLDPDFIYYWYLTVANDVLAAGQGATVLGVKVPYVASLEIPLPPLDEQKRIVAKLDEVMEADWVLTASKDAKTKELRSLIERISGSCFEELLGNPEVAVHPLKDIVDSVNVGFVGTSTNDRDPNGIPYLTARNIKAGYLDYQDMDRISNEFHTQHKKSQVSSGDVVVVRIGNSGQAAPVPPSLPVAHAADLVVIRQPQRVTPNFLTAYLNSPQGRHFSLSKTGGTTRRTLNTSVVAEMPVPVPSLSKQDAVTSRLDAASHAVEELLQLHKRQISETSQLVSSLLRKELRGAA